MRKFRSWKKKRVCRPELLLQQLEERIVLDAAVNPAPQDNPHDNPANPQDPVGGLDTSPAADAAAAGGAGGGNAGLVAQLPDSFNHVFSENLNVVLISNALTDVKTISDAATDNAKVIVYDAQHDNLATVVGKLDDLVNSTGHKIGIVAVFDHGGEGFLDVGTDQINLRNLWAYEAAFVTLSHDIASGAQIQFYACDTAGNALGTDLVNSIALYAGANVFASVDDTGGTHGNWTLEYSSSLGASFHSIIDSGSLVSMQADLGGNPGEPTNTWFHGTGAFTGWDVYNYAQGVYYTNDYVHYWDHKDAGGSWSYYNTKAWVGTDNLGDAPYDGGYGPLATWFHVSSGTYAGDVYIGDAITYYSSNYAAPGATFWSHSDTGWSYFDTSKWVPTSGFHVEPMNVWFHGYGSDAGWDTYNTTGVQYYSKDYAVYWSHTDAGNVWKFYNTMTWVTTDNLGRAPYDGGYGPYEQIFTANSGPFNGNEVFIGSGVTLYSTNHFATCYGHAYDGSWWYHDGSNWEPAVSPLNAEDGSTIWINGEPYYVFHMTTPGEYIVSEGAHLIIFGTSGDDRIQSNNTGCIIFGGAGNDVIYDGAGTDWLFGNAGNDVIFSQEGGNDFIDGGEGDDQLGIYSPANTTVVGGYGNDTFYLGGNPSSGTYICHGGPDNDAFLVYWNDPPRPYFRMYGGSGGDSLYIGTGYAGYTWNEDGDEWPNQYPGLFPWRQPWETGWEYVRWPV